MRSGIEPARSRVGWEQDQMPAGGARTPTVQIVLLLNRLDRAAVCEPGIGPQ